MSQCDHVLMCKARLWLGISNHAFDADIADTLEAGKLDLGISGVYKLDGSLAEQALKNYIRWQYNYQGGAERYERMYRELKRALGLCSDYNTKPETEEEQ